MCILCFYAAAAARPFRSVDQSSADDGSSLINSFKYSNGDGYLIHSFVGLNCTTKLKLQANDEGTNVRSYEYYYVTRRSELESNSDESIDMLSVCD